MKVMEAIKERFSARNYAPKKVEDEKLKSVFEAARLAPSASNRQEWRFVVVRDEEKRKKLAVAANNQKFVGEAPVVIACCAETDNHIMRCGQLTYPIDLAIAIDHMTLEATELGLGTCWIGSFFEDEVKKILNIPKEIRVVELLTLGYSTEKAGKQKPRKQFSEIVKYEDWESK